MAMGFHRPVLITGAAGGLGRHIYRRCAETKRTSILTDHPSRKGELQRLYEEMKESTKARTLIYPADITEEREIRGMFGYVDSVSPHGLYGLVNCAGVLEGRVTRPEDWDFKEAQRVMDVNFFGAARCVKYAAPLLRKNRGVIVNILGVGARQGDSVAPYYAAAKAALANATLSWSKEFEGEVRVVGIYPGMMERTPMAEADPEFTKMAAAHMHGGLLKPEEVADFIVSALRPDSRIVGNVAYDAGLNW